MQISSAAVGFAVEDRYLITITSHVYKVYIVLTLLTNDKLLTLLVLLLVPYIFS